MFDDILLMDGLSCTVLMDRQPELNCERPHPVESLGGRGDIHSCKDVKLKPPLYLRLVV